MFFEKLLEIKGVHKKARKLKILIQGHMQETVFGMWYLRSKGRAPSSPPNFSAAMHWQCDSLLADKRTSLKFRITAYIQTPLRKVTQT